MLLFNLEVLKKLGTPYKDDYDDEEWVMKQMDRDSKRIAERIARDLKEDVPPDTEVIALIAYMQKLGSDIKWRKKK